MLQLNLHFFPHESKKCTPHICHRTAGPPNFVFFSRFDFVYIFDDRQIYGSLELVVSSLLP